jgi:hypothetical protein
MLCKLKRAVGSVNFVASDFNHWILNKTMISPVFGGLKSTATKLTEPMALLKLTNLTSKKPSLQKKTWLF